MLVAYFPAIVFWILDGYFLSQERCFRALYDHVRGLEENQIDFSMNTAPFRDQPGNSWGSAMISKTLLIYYGALASTMLFLMFAIR